MGPVGARQCITVRDCIHDSVTEKGKCVSASRRAIPASATSATSKSNPMSCSSLNAVVAATSARSLRVSASSFEARVKQVVIPVTHLDSDGVGDFTDNGPAIANSDQADSARDGVGDACDQLSRQAVLPHR